MNRKVLTTSGALAVVGAMALSSIMPVAARSVIDGNRAGTVAHSPSSNHVFQMQSAYRAATVPLRVFAKPIVPDVNPTDVETVDSHDTLPTLKGRYGLLGPRVRTRIAQPSLPTSILNWTGSTPATTISIEGLNRVTSGCVCRPPDTNGAASTNYYVQDTNVAFEVWSKTGARVLGPVNINQLFSAFPDGTACKVQNSGDPVVNYDRLADRWVISQFTSSHPYEECIAVSQTGDPTGAYFIYQFDLPGFHIVGNSLTLRLNQAFQDYPKLSVWPNGYYMTTNQFPDDPNYFPDYGANTYVFNRAQMLAGATMVTGIQAVFPGQGGLLAADLDGTTLPPVGAPESIVENWNNNDGFGNGSLLMYHLSVDFSNLDNTTLDNGTFINVAPWNWLCTDFVTYFDRNCFAQPHQAVSSQSLDSLGDRILFRAAYRNFGDHEGLLINQGVDQNAGGRGHTPNAGVRWYELRDVSSNPYLYQQGTIAPDNGNRWMGSLAFDKNGDIAAGYSVVNANSGPPVSPSIRYSTRLTTDPLGTFNAEKSLAAGVGYQTSHSSRWGDYSDMVIDPSNDCSFWYTNEYYNTVGGPGVQFTGMWHTRIGKFTIPECASARLQSAPNSSLTPAISTTAGQSSSNALLGAFHDSQPGCGTSGASYHALINWGDLSTPSYGTVSKVGTQCRFNVNATSHVYANSGTYQIVVVVQNATGATTTLTGVASISTS